MKPRWLNLLLIATLGLTACSEAPPQVHKAKLFTLGTLVDVSVLHQDKATAQQAVTIVETELATINRQWHAWRDSPLTLINQQLAQGKTVTIDSTSHHFLQQAQTLAANSDQLFNPTIGSLVEQWGFHNDERPDGAPPAKERIDAELKQAPSMANITLTKTTLASNNSAVQFDFGAFGKGYAIDRAVEKLKLAGIKNAIVNAGGDLRAIGSKGDRPWRIGVRHPTAAGVIASIETDGDESVFTSGNYERFFDFDGSRYHHIIDPRNGYPANDAVSVTVIHNNAATADAAATALFIAGTTQWPQIAKQMGVDEVMLIGNDLTIYMTKKMTRRIHLEIDDVQIKIIGDDT
ncbi:FAD:protein FMN transferase [hydrothermal vent metagenome]|uniref:FAD:protein FMN transferase n=1 Tax=hydrothermal vent metagenome TaxID=652676 RepID=A0A3B1AB17_9ZZZZ